ncbi:MAG: DegV family protein [Lachnospiraceae bacterium]|nr:DegV family protein [Lachnospiraceae bacterium]
MSKNLRIILDSTTDIAEELKDRFTIVPLIVSFGEKEYLDGIDISRNEFYEKLETGEGDELPKTSQASPATFEEYYEEVRKAGEEAIVITVSSTLSGTYQSACIAASEYPEIRVVDSKSVAVGTGILAEYALKRAEEGAGLEELSTELEEKKNEIILLAMLDTLEYLKRGGRISKAKATIGDVLNIKPVVTVLDGEIQILGKARGTRKANNFLIRQIKEKAVDFDLPVLLGYSGTSDALLLQYIEDSRCIWEDQVKQLNLSQICSVVGTHVGPGAVAVAYFAKKN